MPATSVNLLIASATYQDFEPLLNQRFVLTHDSGLALHLDLIQVQPGRPLPENAKVARKQPFSLLFQWVDGERNVVSGTFLVTTPVQVDFPLLINQIQCPMDRDPAFAYFEICFS